MEKENVFCGEIFLRGGSKTEKEKEENIRRRKIFDLWRRKKRRRKRRKIFGEKKVFLWRKTERENIFRRRNCCGPLEH